MTNHYTYVQVNIGRNIGDEIADITSWSIFQAKVAAAITRASQREPRWVEYHDKDVSLPVPIEQGVHISAMLYRPRLDALRADLRAIKHDHKQDSIALIVGSELL
jgi:hypothetical protein